MSVIEILKNKWVVPKDTRPSFEGRNIIVTGSNVGLGYEAALKFVRLGAAKVILGVRTLSKGEEAKRQIETTSRRKGIVEVWHLDMLDYASIKSFADKATRELDHLDIAVLNAGVVAIHYEKTVYGHERIMQINVLSTTYLALLLLPKLKASKTSSYTPVLEIVGSNISYADTKLQDTNTPFASYNMMSGFGGAQEQYRVSKVFVNYVQASLLPLVVNKETGESDVHVTVCCPGACRSEIARDLTAWYFKLLLVLFSILIQRTAEEGARTYVSGVTQTEEKHGKFWKDDCVRGPAPLSVGEQGKRLQAKVWKEVIEALAQDIPDAKQLAGM